MGLPLELRQAKTCAVVVPPAAVAVIECALTEQIRYSPADVVLANSNIVKANWGTLLIGRFIFFGEILSSEKILNR